MPDYKNISVHHDTWKKLKELQLEEEYNSFNELIKEEIDFS